MPYSKEADAKIPVGTVMPGVLIIGNYEGDRADLVGGSRWKDGYWTLELSRKMKTGSNTTRTSCRQGALHVGRGFDHVQTRHTRHPRPVRVVTQE